MFVASPGAAAVAGAHPGYKSANYYTTYPFYAAGSGAVQTLNRLVYTPMYVSKDVTISALALTTTAVATAVARLGLYTVAANGTPGTLIVEFGVLDISPTGSPELAVSRLIPAGWYFIGAAFQVAAGNVGQIAQSSQAFVGHTVPFVNNMSAHFENGISGALPATATPTTAGGANGIWIEFKVA